MVLHRINDVRVHRVNDARAVIAECNSLKLHFCSQVAEEEEDEQGDDECGNEFRRCEGRTGSKEGQSGPARSGPVRSGPVRSGLVRGAEWADYAAALLLPNARHDRHPVPPTQLWKIAVGPILRG